MKIVSIVQNGVDFHYLDFNVGVNRDCEYWNRLRTKPAFLIIFVVQAPRPALTAAPDSTADQLVCIKISLNQLSNR